MYLFPASRGHRQTTNGMSPIVKDLDKQIKQYPAINNITASNNTLLVLRRKIMYKQTMYNFLLLHLMYLL
jgi:hypothetical protein